MSAVTSGVMPREPTPAKRALRWLLRRRGAMLGLVIVVFFVLLAVFASRIAPYAPIATSWGSMLNTAKNYVDNSPQMAIWPGLSIFLLVLSFNLLGDGLRDALDPKHK